MTDVGDGGYHHGDLPAALLRAVREIIAEDGVGAVSVRAVARRAGVSHAAPAHHFGDRSGLLAALAAEGFALFVDRMVAAVAALAPDATAADAFGAMGEAYIEFGLEHPEYYSVMFRPEMVDREDDELEETGSRALGCVVAVSRACLEPDAGDEEVVELAMTGWAMVHGFVSLAHDMPTIKSEYVDLLGGMVDGVQQTLRAGMRSHPRWIGDDVLASSIPADLSDPVVARPDQ